MTITTILDLTANPQPVRIVTLVTFEKGIYMDVRHRNKKLPIKMNILGKDSLSAVNGMCGMLSNITENNSDLSFSL